MYIVIKIIDAMWIDLGKDPLVIFLHVKIVIMYLYFITCFLLLLLSAK